MSLFCSDSMSHQGLADNKIAPSHFLQECRTHGHETSGLPDSTCSLIYVLPGTPPLPLASFRIKEWQKKMETTIMGYIGLL